MTEVLCSRKFVTRGRPEGEYFGFDFDLPYPDGRVRKLLTLYSYDPDAYTVGFWYELTLNHTTRERERE